MLSIGYQKACASTIFQRFGLVPFRGILPPEVFVAAARDGGCAPRRERPLIPEVVAWLMMYVGLQTTSMTQGLCGAWGLVRGVCPWLQDGCVTEEAFCQARRQLTIGFWRDLWERLVSRFEAKFASSLLWKNTFRLLAIDGADVDLPNTPMVARFFGRPRNGKGEGRQPQAKLVALCSVFTGFCFAFKLIAKRFTEHHALQHLIRCLRLDDLVLMDRGFFPYAAIWRIPLRGAHFLIRLSDQQAGYTKSRRALTDNEWIVEFRPTPATRRKDPDLPEVLVARLLRYQWPGFRPSWLLTSLLDEQVHLHAELVDLYHRRWQIETIYREWKHGLDIQNLRSHTPAGVIKEVHAHLLLSNLVRWVMTDAVCGIDLHPVDLSYLTALTHVKNALLQMLRADTRRICLIYQQLLQEIRRARIRKRPGRSYPRRSDKPRDRGNGHFQQPARLSGA